MKSRLAISCLLAAGVLQGCGLAETTVAAGAAGGAAGQQAQQAQETMDTVREDVGKAQDIAAERLKAAEEASQ